MQRIIGTEVEYGISSPSDPTANPILTSTQAVLAYAAAAGIQRAKRTRWDYEVESPLRDARGFDLSRSAGPPPVVDADEVGAANMILTNGARLYVDHAHPEYSAPECTDPLDAVIWDKAGERVMEAAARHVASVPGAAKLQLYKNNVDGKGASYGAHENYLMSRQTPFSSIIAGLTPFLVSRQVVTGSGRVGIGPSGDEPGFQLSQRSDYIEVEVGLETTLKRGIINTRDEPHADADRYRRLHVIIGDANLAETSTYLKLGTTALVLDLIEVGPEHGIDLSDLVLARPVHAVHAISRDPSLRAAVALADGRELTGLALQRIYLDRVAKLVDSRDPDPRAADIVETWAQVLDQLERDPMDCAELLDWPAKLRLLEGFRQRENLSWSAPRLHLVDLQYSDVRLDKGLYNRLVARGSMKRLVSEQQVLDVTGDRAGLGGHRLLLSERFRRGVQHAQALRRRLQPGHATEGGRPPDTAAEVATQAERAAAVSDDGCFPTGAAPRCSGRVPRVVGPAEHGVVGFVNEQELGDVRLAQNHGSGLAKPLDQRPVGRCDVPAAGDEANGGRHAGHVELVLDGDRNAVQRTEVLAGGLVSIRLGSLPPCAVKSALDHGVDRSVTRLDPLDAGFEGGCRSQGTVADLSRQLRRARQQRARRALNSRCVGRSAASHFQPPCSRGTP